MTLDRKEISLFIEQSVSDLIDKKIVDNEFSSRNDFVVSAIRYHQDWMRDAICQSMFGADLLISESRVISGQSEVNDMMLKSHSDKLVRNSFYVSPFSYRDDVLEARPVKVRYGVRIPEGLMQTWHFYERYFPQELDFSNYVRLCIRMYLSHLNENTVIEQAFITYSSPDKTEEDCRVLNEQLKLIIGYRHGHILNADWKGSI